MEATALIEPLTQAYVRPRVRVSECRLFRAAVTMIALHIIDDEFLQRPPGTSTQRPFACRSADDRWRSVADDWRRPRSA
jgi:hypothetical protein